MKDSKKIAFIYEGPHKINKEWAESLNARFIPNIGAGPKGDNPTWKRLIRAFLSLFIFFKIPKDTDALFVEEGLGILPAYLFLKIRKNKKGALLMSGQLPYYLNDPNSGIFYKVRKIMWRIINYFDGVIVKSSITYNLINVPDKNKKIVHSHIDKSKFSRIKKREKNLISIGTIDYRKGNDKMIKVFKEIKKDFPKIKYFSLGRGKLPEKPRGLIKVGYTKEIDKYLKKSSIMLHLSRADAFPLAVLEGMAAGVVPIISKEVGTKDILKKVDKSLIVKNEKEAVKKVKELLKNKKKFKKLSKRCREEASKLTREKQIKKFQSTFWEFVG